MTTSLIEIAVAEIKQLAVVEPKQASKKFELIANTLSDEQLTEVIEQIETDLNTVALLMTHNFEYEVIVLEKLLTCMIPYVGILGPKRKTEKLIQRLESKGLQVSTDNIYAPIGLEIGAETSEEIALSILAEIKAVLNRKQPIFLRDKQGPIHEKAG